MRVLLIEDDATLRSQVASLFQRQGWNVTTAGDLGTARAAAPSGFELIVLDLMLPDGFGLDLLREIRRSADVPILVLSARETAAEKARALDLGADDYVVKPFWPEELVARARARLRRPIATRGRAVRFGPLSVELDGSRVELDGEAVELTTAERAILVALLHRVGRPVSRATLEEAAGLESAARALDVHVMRLRKKLGATGERLETAWGIGYRLRGDG